jgi:hypothetical protein
MFGGPWCKTCKEGVIVIIHVMLQIVDCVTFLLAISTFTIYITQCNFFYIISWVSSLIYKTYKCIQNAELQQLYQWKLPTLRRVQIETEFRIFGRLCSRKKIDNWMNVFKRSSIIVLRKYNKLDTQPLAIVCRQHTCTLFGVFIIPAYTIWSSAV